MRRRFEDYTSSTLARFLIAGGISFVVNQAALFALYEFVFDGIRHSADTIAGGVNPALLLSSTIAVEIAIVARFFLNDGWTFRERREQPLIRRFWQSNVSSFGSPLIALTSVNILTPVFGINYLVANTIGVALGFGWNWVWSTRVVWRPVATEIVPVE